MSYCHDKDEAMQLLKTFIWNKRLVTLATELISITPNYSIKHYFVNETETKMLVITKKQLKGERQELSKSKYKRTLHIYLKEKARASLQVFRFNSFNTLPNEWGRTEDINNLRSLDELFSVSSLISDLEHGAKVLS